ncbi:uncharacterized protein LOC114540733 [Dendronephthya gigantea]|uniref:uncharacterized protein LOC114540733 n=1 Tax=Dendronephthya gigantea TaxID=151771 RepID=UPI00106D68F7|nr:uncharacterized protein LOC114540733 [Dendronephthya gigantea]
MLGKLLPWSNDAVRGYSVFTYTQQLDQSLVEYLRDQLGNWWSADMHTLVGGMHSLPEAFFKCKEHPLVTDDIQKQKQVYKICYYSSPSQPNNDYVIVSCYANPCKCFLLCKEQESHYTARAVILTTQVNILRQITFDPILPTQELFRYNLYRYLWEPMGNVHFAGDNISFTAGWIQGAVESGFKSAYQVYARHMKRVKLGGRC